MEKVEVLQQLIRTIDKGKKELEASKGKRIASFQIADNGQFFFLTLVRGGERLDYCLRQDRETCHKCMDQEACQIQRQEYGLGFGSQKESKSRSNNNHSNPKKGTSC